jgi:hypothetical protein
VYTKTRYSPDVTDAVPVDVALPETEAETIVKPPGTVPNPDKTECCDGDAEALKRRPPSKFCSLLAVTEYDNVPVLPISNHNLASVASPLPLRIAVTVVVPLNEYDTEPAAGYTKLLAYVKIEDKTGVTALLADEYPPAPKVTAATLNT